MRLLITTPTDVMLDDPDVVALRAEDESGGFGILRWPCGFPDGIDDFGGELAPRR